MHIITEKRVKDFCVLHVDATPSIRAWVAETRRANWKNYIDIKNTFPKADNPIDNIVVFNIAWNRYRLVVDIHYFNGTSNGTVFVRWIGLHADYTGVDVRILCKKQK